MLHLLDIEQPFVELVRVLEELCVAAGGVDDPGGDEDDQAGRQQQSCYRTELEVRAHSVLQQVDK